ncbi:hypothetical protein EVAR_78851_1 [Eumeta japonica]|uniref:Uncharacterized protein n=1 Tax=Eumeta variegata TaxID=151549 RepID=A0A4C1U293_EUMVA|nr:hypothetical protein EVAR_78851_1 [Eumeta japonica]
MLDDGEGRDICKDRNHVGISNLWSPPTPPENRSLAPTEGMQANPQAKAYFIILYSMVVPFGARDNLFHTAAYATRTNAHILATPAWDRFHHGVGVRSTSTF